MKFILRAIYLAMFCFALLAVGVYSLYRSAQSAPEFYEQALAVDNDTLAVEGDEFEKRILDMQNDARTNQKWQATFTDSQVNGWIASDMPEKFPGTLPSNVVDPRVAMLPNELNIAVRIQTGALEGIVVAAADVFCTAEGQIAVQVKSVRAGYIKLPAAQFADAISTSLRKSGINVTWTEKDGDQVALLDLPEDFVTFEEYRVRLTGIVIEEGQLVLSGETVGP